MSWSATSLRSLPTICGWRADVQYVVADASDQRCLPTGGDGAERVPGVAGNHAEFGRLNAKLILDVDISLRRRLVMLHAVGAEAPFEQIDDAAMRKLASLHAGLSVRQKSRKPAVRSLHNAQGTSW